MSKPRRDVCEHCNRIVWFDRKGRYTASWTGDHGHSPECPIAAELAARSETKVEMT